MSKPIRVFYSPLSQRFYASRAYREEKPGIVVITGEKFDVSNDIAELVLRYGITFKERDALPSAPSVPDSEGKVDEERIADFFELWTNRYSQLQDDEEIASAVKIGHEAYEQIKRTKDFAASRREGLIAGLLALRQRSEEKK